MANNKVILGNEVLIDLTGDTVSANNLLAGETAHDASGSAISGSMPNQGTKTASLDAGQSYTIPQGYHSGSGVVTANSLASQTVGTATVNDIASGLTAWVNGTKLTGTATAGGATITVTYTSSFYNKTMTCTKGSTTYTQTTTSSGSTVFNVTDEGTWTITCNGVSRTVNVVLNYSTQMAITKTITIYGAKEDYITYTDATGSKVCQFASGQTSKSVNITFIPPSQSITFTSTVAKNPNNLSQNYSKSITITESTTSIYVMPTKAIYWYGWESSTSWSTSGGDVVGTITRSTIQIRFQSPKRATSGVQSAKFTSPSIASGTCTTIKWYIKETHSAGYAYTLNWDGSNIGAGVDGASSNTPTNEVLSHSITSNTNISTAITVRSNQSDVGYVDTYALWLE